MAGADNPRIRHELIDEVVASARRLWDLELTPGGDGGDTSLRDPNSGLIYILPQSPPDRGLTNWSEIRPEEIAVVDGRGASATANRPRPTVEIETHLRIYEARPEVLAIVHSHGEWSQLFSILRSDIPTFTSETFFVGGMGPIRCAPTGGVATPECATEAVKALGTRARSALLPSHGAVCVGRNFDEAFHAAVMTERAARQAFRLRMFGGADQMTLGDLMGAERLAQMEAFAASSGETVEDVLARSL
jgi:ribulose-5-phosphate 4-epimerase/fuculose-1-phosphate aldolase